jgi:hypothetical protein
LDEIEQRMEWTKAQGGCQEGPCMAESDGDILFAHIRELRTALHSITRYVPSSVSSEDAGRILAAAALLDRQTPPEVTP